MATNYPELLVNFDNFFVYMHAHSEMYVFTKGRGWGRGGKGED